MGTPTTHSDVDGALTAKMCAKVETRVPRRTPGVAPVAPRVPKSGRKSVHKLMQADVEI